MKPLNCDRGSSAVRLVRLPSRFSAVRANYIDRAFFRAWFGGERGSALIAHGSAVYISSGGKSHANSPTKNITSGIAAAESSDDIPTAPAASVGLIP